MSKLQPRHFVPGYYQPVPPGHQSLPPGQKPFTHRSASRGLDYEGERAAEPTKSIKRRALSGARVFRSLLK
jgi:hypothetical protein